MCAKIVRAKGVACVATIRAIQIKRGVSYGDAAETVHAAATGISTWIAAVLTCAGVATSRRAALECGVVYGSAAAADVCAAALGDTACAAVLLIARTVTPNSARSAAQSNARSVKVERSALEIDGSAPGVRARAVVEVAAIAAKCAVTCEGTIG